jgi:hypothetical protein
MIEERKSHSILNYMNSSLPSWKWLWMMLLAASGAVILFWGIDHANDLFYTFALGSHELGQYELDPTLSQYIPNKLPLFFKLFSSVYEIPFYHLLFGVLFKGLVLIAYFFLSWKITRSTFASIFSVFMIFGLFKFELGAETILNLKLPFVPDSMEFRHWGYLSFRQASAPFVVLGTLFFLGRSFILSSIFIAFGVYCHPHSGMIFFASLNLSFLFCLFFWKDKFAILKSWAKFAFPFIIVTSPYLLSALSTFRDVSPIPFDLFWELNLKNEPDDVSLLFNLRHNHPPYYLNFVFTLAALCLHFLFKSKYPKTNLNIKNLIQDDKDFLWPMLLAPWVLVAFGYVWESGLMIYLPEFVNDLICSLHIRRASNVTSILYMPIYSVLFSKIILVLSEKLGWEIFGDQALSKLKIRLEKIKLKSVDHAFAVGLSLITLLIVLLVKFKNIEDFKEFWVFDPVGYELSLPEKTSLFGFPGNKEITVSSFLDACSWIQKNTPEKAAFFNPAYMRPFRTCTKRQAFVEEKLDGNQSLVDRRFSTIFHRRMADIHQGLSYNDLPGHPVNGREFYLTMRQRYLSINDEIVEDLKEKYPGYRYFFTEKGHELSYPVSYQNLHLIIYDLGVEQSKIN